MNRSVKVLVSPIFDPWYYEFYYKGLIDFYGKENVKFEYKGIFTTFIKYVNTKFKKDFFYYEIVREGVTKKIVISAEDWTDINSELYEIVDCYAKVNVEEKQLVDSEKLLPIGPGFGIRYFSLPKYLFFSLNFFLKTNIKNPYLKTFFNLSLKRSYLDSYSFEKAKKENFIFYLNYPWSKHQGVTNMRKEIISILVSMANKNKINFEGGFSKRRFGYHKGFENFSAKKIYNHSEYLKSLKKSVIAINTPAVHDCFGWKLGEYILLNKPIISMPLNRVMPGDFVSGIHFHEIKNIEGELEQELMFLLENKEYTDSLVKNVTAYSQDYLLPKKVIERIHNAAFVNNSN